MPTYQEKLERVFNVSLGVSNVKDVDVLMETILDAARDLVNADAGSIYIKQDDRLHFNYSQNETLRARLGPHKKLPYNTFSIPIDGSSIAGHVASTGEVLNIPNVYELPRGVPYSFSRKYDEISQYRTQSVLTMPLKDNRDEAIGVLQIINAHDDAGRIVPFAEEDVPLLMHFASNAAIAIERAEMTRRTILRMIKMAELRDPYETGPHASRVASYSLEIFEAWAIAKGMPSGEIHTLKDILKVAAILHDVGKIAISDSILRKPGKLSDEEFGAMKAHTFLGARLFADGNSELDRAAATVALNHHERWDGTGYPGHIDPATGKALYEEADGGRARGKRGNEIPLFGRIVAIADVYDALCSRRSYKQAWSEEDVIAEMKRSSGTHFDPELIEAFLESLDEIREVAKRYPS